MGASSMPVLPSLTPEKNWLARNWKWFVPALVVLILLLIAAGIAGIVAVLAGSMRSIEPYQYAMVAASTNQQVLDALGPPIHAKWYVSGSFSVSGPSGEASLEIPLQGTTRGGTLYVEARKRAGEWSYQRLELEAEGQSQRIYLLRSSGGQSGKY